MSNHFVSGGTIGPDGEAFKDEGNEANPPVREAPKNAEWEAVQQELEADRKRRDEQRRKAATGEEKSLYDILQANKAAKQEAFEEANKIRNQFRALDDDEIDFLDDVRQRQRQEEERVRMETEEGLKAFRKRQKSDGGGGEAEEGLTQEQQEKEEWAVGRKRKRVKDKELKGLKKKTSDGDSSALAEAGEGAAATAAGIEAEAVVKKKGEEEAKETAAPAAVAVKKGLSLVDYGSDSDDE